MVHRIDEDTPPVDDEAEYQAAHDRYAAAQKLNDDTAMAEALFTIDRLAARAPGKRRLEFQSR